MTTVARFLIEATPLRGNHWGGVVSGLGIVFGLIEFAHIQAMSTPVGISLEAVLPFIGAIGLIGAGYLLWTEQYLYDEVDVPRVVIWTIIGMTGMAIIFLWILSHQLIRGGMFHHAHFILVNNLIVGGLIGFVIGTYDARSLAYQRSIEQERLKHDFLNRELRHHVLNGMNVILGQLDRIEAHTDPELQDTIQEIGEHGTEIIDRIESVREIARAFTEQGSAPLSQQNVSEAVSDVVAQVDKRYPEATISADVPAEVSVCADEFLPIVIENLVTNAIEHNDTDSPHVNITVTVGEGLAVLRIADNGPGFPQEHRASVFSWREPAGGNIETGIGLAIVSVLVDRYGGRVWIEDNQPRGAVVNIELSQSM